MKRTHALIAATAAGAAAFAGAAAAVEAATVHSAAATAGAAHAAPAPKKAVQAVAKGRTTRRLGALAAPTATAGPKVKVVLQKPVIKSISSPTAGMGAGTGSGHDDAFDDDGFHHDGSHHDGSHNDENEGADD